MPTYKYLNDTGLERALNKLKAYIDSQSGGGSDGHGFIICDTSTMQVGDKIRVRSVYTVLEEQYNQTKEVVTVGQPVVFTVPCYDYYKICTIQTINDTPTEVGGVYRTVDYGQTLFIDVIDKKSFSGIKGILNAGQETTQLQVGDEVHTLVDGSDWIMQIADINTYKTGQVLLVSKYLWKASTYNPTGGTYYSEDTIRSEVTSFLGKLPQVDQDCIATMSKPQHTTAYQNRSWSTFSDKIWIPNTYEILGTTGNIGTYYGTPPLTLTQFDIFTSQQGRVRGLESGGNQEWWTCDGTAQGYGGGQYQTITATGESSGKNYNTSQYILPCCAIEADS